MEVIRDKNGDVIRTSSNLAGICKHVAQGLKYPRYNLIDVISVDELRKGEGKLMIVFENGDTYETNFASFQVLRGWVRRWRNVHGSPLRVNGADVGKVTSDNPVLI